MISSLYRTVRWTEIERLKISSRATKLADTTVTGQPTRPRNPVILISPKTQHAIEMNIHLGFLKMIKRATIRKRRIAAPKI